MRVCYDALILPSNRKDDGADDIIQFRLTFLRGSMFRIEAHIKEDEDKGLFIDPRAAEYVHYTPKPYVFQPAPATKLS